MSIELWQKEQRWLGLDRVFVRLQRPAGHSLLGLRATGLPIAGLKRNVWLMIESETVRSVLSIVYAEFCRIRICSRWRFREPILPWNNDERAGRGSQPHWPVEASGHQSFWRLGPVMPGMCSPGAVRRRRSVKAQLTCHCTERQSNKWLPRLPSLRAGCPLFMLHMPLPGTTGFLGLHAARLDALPIGWWHHEANQKVCLSLRVGCCSIT